MAFLPLSDFCVDPESGKQWETPSVPDVVAASMAPNSPVRARA
jgi:hypothetical protein